MHCRRILGGALALLAWFAIPAAAQQADRWTMPIRTHTLDNGLTVVVSEDRSSPTVGVSVVYHVGMRLEPQDRTGFAHLFEHLMFQGTPVAPKGTFDRVIQGGGGILNGSTRPDFTNYIETAPVSALKPILWLEADRMKTLDFSPANLRNQQDVVKEEIRVNVQNQPYGLFFVFDMNRLAFSNWANAHDGYGSFEDLEGATLADVEAFHRDYYGPNNAVVGIVGDVSADEAFALVEEYFGDIPARPTPERGRVRATCYRRQARSAGRCAGTGAGARSGLEDARTRQRRPCAHGGAVAAAGRRRCLASVPGAGEGPRAAAQP